MVKEYIEKQALIEAFEPERNVDWYTPWIVDKIKEAPTADVVEVVHAKWEHCGGDEWFCTNCGEVIHTEGSWEKPEKKFCHECGAKMDGKKVE